MSCYYRQRQKIWVLIVSGIYLTLNPSLVYSNNPEKLPKESQAKIEFITGRSETLSMPSIQGKFSGPDFEITKLSLDAVDRIISKVHDGKPRKLIITLRDRGEEIIVHPDQEVSISGSGEWGKEKIPCSKILSLTISHPNPPLPFVPTYKWLCSFANGKKLPIGWSSKWSVNRSFQGTLGKVSFNLDPTAVENLSFLNHVVTTSCWGEGRFKGWYPKSKTLDAKCRFGHLSIEWSKIKSLKNLIPKRAETTRQYGLSSWFLTLRQGTVLPVLDLNPERETKINGEIQVISFNWNAVDSVTPDSSGLKLKLNNDAEWTMSGSLTAITPYGKMIVACKEIGELKRREDKHYSSSPEDTPGKIRGKLVTVSGREYFSILSELSKAAWVHSDDDYFGHDLFIIDTPPIEFWLSTKALLSYPLKIKKGRLFSENPILKDQPALTGIKSLKFKNFAGEFKVPLKVLKEYIPRPAPGSSSYSRKAGFRIKARSKTGSSGPVAVSKIEFARYPARGWCGTYYKSSYPFQWHRAGQLFFMREKDQARINVEFDKIGKITFENRYGRSRKATLTSTQGGEMKGKIYPGDVTKSFPGVSSWSYDKEGLLGKIGNRAYIFIRFKDVQEIEIEQIG